MKRIENLKSIVEKDASFKDDFFYISDSFNANLVSTYNHSNDLENIDDLYSVSEDRIRSKILSNHTEDVNMYDEVEEIANNIITEHTEKILSLEKEISGHKKYISHAALNPEVIKIDFIMAWSLTFLFFLLYCLTAFAEIALAKFFLEFTMDTMDSKVLEAMGKLVYIIGAVPALIMCLGFFNKVKFISFRNILILEAIWIATYGLTLITFGVTFPAEAIQEMMNNTISIDFDVRSLTGWLMVITQALLLTGLGFYFTSQASVYFASTRINKITPNPLWVSINKHIEELNINNNQLHTVIASIKGKRDKVNQHIKEILALNKLSINKYLQIFENIDLSIDKHRELIQENESENKELRTYLSRLLDKKLNYLEPLNKNLSVEYKD